MTRHDAPPVEAGTIDDTETAEGVAELITYYARLRNPGAISDAVCDYLRETIAEQLIRFEERGRSEAEEQANWRDPARE